MELRKGQVKMIRVRKYRNIVHRETTYATALSKERKSLKHGRECTLSDILSFKVPVVGVGGGDPR